MSRTKLSVFNLAAPLQQGRVRIFTSQHVAANANKFSVRGHVLRGRAHVEAASQMIVAYRSSAGPSGRRRAGRVPLDGAAVSGGGLGAASPATCHLAPAESVESTALNLKLR
ncbi:hypothetical protein EVAR_17835_1 [Eumeta japonica]|uniref:Uncharacterized protein n=1 Tax=Eumeta variegata TaxID=151549 RepID=A0A4C1TTK2_EUMVA|nr:hypothetical protein EVAR_17835_1 [Eumeta japonica]